MQPGFGVLEAFGNLFNPKNSDETDIIEFLRTQIGLISNHQPSRWYDYFDMGSLGEIRDELDKLPERESKQQLPKWDCESRNLTYRGKRILSLSTRVKNAIIILNTFHELQWERDIDSPIPGIKREDKKSFQKGKVIDTKKRDRNRLENTIHDLNSRIHDSVLRFYTIKGEKIGWKVEKTG